MSPPRKIGSSKYGRVMIHQKGIKKFVGGSYQVYQGVTAQQVIKALKKDPRKYLDHYVFEQKVDPNKPELNYIFVFSGDATKFDRAKGDRSKFTLMQTNRLGTMLRRGDAKFVGMVDRKWKYPVRIVKAKVYVPKGQRLTRHQKKLQRIFAKRLKEKIGGKKIGIPEIGLAIQKVAEDMRELCARAEQPHIEIVKDPKGKRGAKALEIRVTLLPAPTGVKIKGVPSALRKKLLSGIGKDMRALLKKHPAFHSMNIDMSLFGGAARPRTKAAPLPLTRVDKHGVITWKFASNTPQREGTAARAVQGRMAGKSFERVPDLVPGQPMPIPQSVFTAMMKRLKKKLEAMPGLYRVYWVVDKGVLSIRVRNYSRAQVILPQVIVDAVKLQTGIDLSAEKKILEGGTKRWSGKQADAFLARLKKKFIAKGRELLVDHKMFYAKTRDNKIVIRPFSVPLLKPSKVSFVGDVNLKGIGGVKALKRLLGRKPMTRAQLQKRLEKIEAHYHKAGYLIMGENPGRTKGRQLALQGKKDGSLRVIVRVVKMGQVRISGKIPARSKAALKKALQTKSGKPFLPKKFMRAIKITLAKLALSLPRAPVFVMRPDGKMDVVVGVQRPKARFDLMAGSDGKYFMGALGGTFHHVIPGFTTFSVSGMAAKDNYGASISVKSLPLNAAGVHLSASLKYIYSYYYYRMGTEQVDEFGMHHYGSGDLTVHIPLGPQGIASPFDLYVSTRGSAIYRDGQKYDGTKVKGINYYVGNSVGISSIHKSVFTKGDTLKGNLSIGLDHNLTTRKGDVTLAGSISYKIPLGKYFALEASASGAVRLPAYGGKLSAERYFGEWSIPLIDFGRSMGDPYSSKHFWHAGVFVMLTHNRYFQPMLGATISGTGTGGVKGGAGVAFKIPIIGLVFYLGSDHRGRLTWGLSAGGVREF